MNCIKKIAYVFVLLLMTTGTAWGMNIFRAAATGNIGRIEELLASGADVNQQDIFGDTPLHGAARYGHANAIRMFIEAGALVNQQDNGGRTPLHLAAMIGRADAIRMLIEAGALINQQDSYGKTAVDIATASNRQHIVALLNDYNQRIEQARQRVPVIAHILARATHHRLGADSPLALLPQELMRHITHLVAEAEEADARRPRQSSDSRSWCIIS